VELDDDVGDKGAIELFVIGGIDKFWHLKSEY